MTYSHLGIDAKRLIKHTSDHVVKFHLDCSQSTLAHRSMLNLNSELQ
jgi:hypothetical protein